MGIDHEHEEEADQDCLEDEYEEEDHKIRITKSNAMMLTMTNYCTGGRMKHKLAKRASSSEVPSNILERANNIGEDNTHRKLRPILQKPYYTMFV